MAILQDPKVQWLKRRIFGKEDPNKILKWTCLLLFWWSVLMIIVMVGLGIAAKYSPPDSSTFGDYEEFRRMGPRFFFPYASFHFLSLIGIALIYRLKYSGIIVYAAASLSCVLFPWLQGFNFSWPTLSFSLICVILFLVHLGSMTKKNGKKKDEELIDTTDAEQQ